MDDFTLGQHLLQFRHACLCYSGVFQDTKGELSQIFKSNVSDFRAILDKTSGGACDASQLQIDELLELGLVLRFN